MSKEERWLAIKKPLVRQVETKKSQICNGQERLLNAPLHNNEMACKKLCHICVVLLPIHLQSVLYWKEMMVLLQKCLLMLATFSRYYIVCKKVTYVRIATHINLSDTDWLTHTFVSCFHINKYQILLQIIYEFSWQLGIIVCTHCIV